MIWRQDDGIWNCGPHIVTKGHKGPADCRHAKVEIVSDRAATVLSLPNGPLLRNALDFAGAGGLQLAQAVSSRLLGVLIALPLELGFQASPFIRVHRLDIGSLEFAVGRRLGRKQCRVGPVDAKFGGLLRVGVHTDARRQANRVCPDFPRRTFEIVVNGCEITASRIARTPSERERQENNRDGRQFCRQRQQAIQPQLRLRQFAAIICTMRRMRDRHADHSDFARLPFATKSRAEAMRSWTGNLNLSLTTTMNEV